MDQDKSQQIEQRELMKVLEKRAMIPEYLKQSQEYLEKFVSEYTDSNTGKVNYRDMIEYLRTFDYERATNEKNVAP